MPLKLVPTEPTPAMVEAGVRAYHAWRMTSIQDMVREIYSAMTDNHDTTPQNNENQRKLFTSQ
jgi:hypothetical protein